MLRIGIVAGEESGDLLGAGLLRALKARHPDLEAEGIAGPRMQAEGCECLYPMERLSVMGLFESFGRYPELIRQRRRLAAYFRAAPPDVFIGIDAPDYNLGLEGWLKSAGIPTVHYVSPSVWAWRSYRVKKIKRAVDRMLTLFPFEADFYRAHGVPVSFVGHPLADSLPAEPDRDAARVALGLHPRHEIVALLPGSRVSELRFLADLMVETARWLLGRRPGLHFLVPLANGPTRALFDETLARTGQGLPITLVQGRSQEAMSAADVVLVASGTAALEAMLLSRPMVVTYKITDLSYFILRRLVKVRQYSLPNLLAGRALVPELIQNAAVPERLGAAVLRYLEHPDLCREAQAEFQRLGAQLRRNASEGAAEAVLELVRRS